MSRAIQTRNAIVQAIADKVGDRVSVFDHGGTFDLEQIKRYAARSPAIVVACVAAPSLEVQGTERKATLRWIAIVITRHGKDEKRDVGALGLVELILHLIADQRWDLDFVHRTTGINAANLFSTDVDARGMALWMITWDQAIDLAGTFAAALADFETLWAKWDLDSSDGIDDDAEDRITLPIV